MAVNKLKKITTVAKQLYKSGKYKKWTDAIKAASKQISGTKTHKDTKSHNVNIRVVSGVKRLSKAKKEYNTDVKNYKYFIFADGKIQSGWEFKSDAMEAATDYEPKAKIYTLQQLKKLGIENPINKWLYKIGAVKIIQKGESKNARVTKVLQQTRTKKGTFKGYKRISGITAAPNYSDADAAREIEIYADNNSALYFSRKLPILKNLQRKFQKGNYKIELAAKLWLYYINDAMQRYHKEFGSRGDKWHDLLSVSDRKLLALEYAKDTLQEFELGNFVN